jgi:putative transposase
MKNKFNKKNIVINEILRYESRIGRIESDITTFHILSRMSWVATKLYNTALWNARKTWKETGKIPSGYELQKVVFKSLYHSLLPSHTYQYPSQEVNKAFKSWFTQRKTDKTTNPPGFRKKESLSSLLFDDNLFRLSTDNNILLTLSKELKKEINYSNRYLKINISRWNTPIPENGKIKQLLVIPKDGYFEVHARIQIPEPNWKTEGQVVAVDLGMKNPIVSMDEAGKIDIFKGTKILSNIRYWNKEKARVQSNIINNSKGKQKNSSNFCKMSIHGTAQTNHAIHAMTSTFVKLCDERNVKEVVVGDLKNIKKSESGKKWNKIASQNWQQFPIRKVVAQLGYKLARYGIHLIEQDERGTSKGRCSLCGCTDKTKLHRIHRGMFHCGNCNTKQNADINGVGNQLVKYLRREIPRSSSGLLANPSVYRWDNHLWMVVT